MATVSCGEYKTRNGRKAVVLGSASHDITNWPLIGYVVEDVGICPCSWTTAGYAGNEHDNDVYDLVCDDHTGCSCCDPTADSPDPVVVRLEAEIRVLQVGLAELGNRLLTLSCDPPRGYRLANQDGLWWLFDHRGEGVEWGDTLEGLVRKLGGEA